MYRCRLLFVEELFPLVQYILSSFRGSFKRMLYLLVFIIAMARSVTWSLMCSENKQILQRAEEMHPQF